MKLIPHGLTASLWHHEIRSLTGVGKLVGPLAQSVLYLQGGTRDASPKAISGRTSYRRVCLAFHPYPQVIPPVFNLGGFGPPRGLTLASPCPWIDHSASGPWHATRRPIQTRFRCGYAKSDYFSSTRRINGSFFKRQAVRIPKDPSTCL